MDTQKNETPLYDRIRQEREEEFRRDLKKMEPYSAAINRFGQVIAPFNRRLSPSVFVYFSGELSLTAVVNGDPEFLIRELIHAGYSVTEPIQGDTRHGKVEWAAKVIGHECEFTLWYDTFQSADAAEQPR